jgi:uncharacterized membrane protein
MKSYKTTIVGSILAALVAVQPLLDGTGYHFDKATITRVVVAGLIAALGYYAKDQNAAN